jgi:hypothetical protein
MYYSSAMQVNHSICGLVEKINNVRQKQCVRLLEDLEKISLFGFYILFYYLAIVIARMHVFDVHILALLSNIFIERTKLTANCNNTQFV